MHIQCTIVPIFCCIGGWLASRKRLYSCDGHSVSIFSFYFVLPCRTFVLLCWL